MASRLNKYTTDKLFELLKETFSKESFYWTQRRCLMNNANASAEDDFVKPSERDEMITYILDICDREDMSLSLETFALAVSLVDRFLSNFKVKSKYLECLSVACLYIACKIKEEDDMISVTSEFLMDCDCKCSIGELLRMEQMILIKFEWSVNDPTAIDFLYIYYGLLVNEFSSAQRCEEMKADSELIWSNFRNTACAMFPNAKASSQSQHQGMIPPPVELDFLHTLEYKLKQVLCVQELTTTYKPHVLAYCLLKMQLDTDAQLSSNKRVQDLMDSIKQMSKLPYETEDKCKEQIKYHLMTIENTKNLFDRYFKEHSAAYRLIRDYRPSASIFMPQLSAIDTKLESIREEDEEEEAAERDMMLYGKAANYMDIMACSDQEAASFLSYADILAGRRRDQKRKLSSSSMSDAEIDYDNRMD